MTATPPSSCERSASALLVATSRREASAPSEVALTAARIAATGVRSAVPVSTGSVPAEVLAESSCSTAAIGPDTAEQVCAVVSAAGADAAGGGAVTVTVGPGTWTVVVPPPDAVPPAPPEVPPPSRPLEPLEVPLPSTGAVDAGSAVGPEVGSVVVEATRAANGSRPRTATASPGPATGSVPVPAEGTADEPGTAVAPGTTTTPLASASSPPPLSRLPATSAPSTSAPPPRARTRSGPRRDVPPPAAREGSPSPGRSGRVGRARRPAGSVTSAAGAGAGSAAGRGAGTVPNGLEVPAAGGSSGSAPKGASSASRGPRASAAASNGPIAGASGPTAGGPPKGLVVMGAPGPFALSGWPRASPR
ncbi:hypothetical protein F1641_18935 [Quadrisphaera sp. INWT6]|nr:hypothetical protein [Quadrisphaera sp. INWT6]